MILKYIRLASLVFILLSCKNPIDTKSANKTYETLANDDEVNNILPKISNWNKWGENDQRGTINYISSERIIEAARLITVGHTISLARETSITQTSGVREGQYEMQKGKYGSRDFVGAVWHGFAVTHLDGLAHVFADTLQMYNGYPVHHLTNDGAGKLGMEHLASSGIAGRGILIDAGEYLKPQLQLGQAILPDQLDWVLAEQNVSLKSGDIVFIRTGFGELNSRKIRTGLHPSCVIWAHENEISLLGSDGDNDAHPIDFERWSSPFHTIGIPYLGLPLIDNANLEELSQFCKREKRYEFFVTINAWRIKGTTSCPINPVAIF